MPFSVSLPVWPMMLTSSFHVVSMALFVVRPVFSVFLPYVCAGFVLLLSHAYKSSMSSLPGRMLPGFTSVLSALPFAVRMYVPAHVNFQFPYRGMPDCRVFTVKTLLCDLPAMCHCWDVMILLQNRTRNGSKRSCFVKKVCNIGRKVCFWLCKRIAFAA